MPGQYHTIQAAINASVNGDTVLIANGTYTGPGNVDLDFGGRNITVTSQNGPASAIIDCGGGPDNHDGFLFHSGETAAVVSGLTIKNGYQHGHTAYPDGSGGGVVVADGSAVTLINCVLTRNSAYSGGGVFNDKGGALTLTHCTVSGNAAYSGNGGGIESAGALTLTGCTVSGNTGGSIFNHTGGALTLTGCVIAGNAAHGNGGVYNDSGTATLADCAITGNAGVGGGVYNTYGAVTLTACLISGNTAYDYGGGVYNNAGGTMTLTNCILSGNTAKYVGGGAFNYEGALTLTNCTVSGNTAPNTGGAFNEYGHLTLLNDIVYGDASGEVLTENNGVATVGYSDIQGGYAGTGNINADPLFVSGSLPYDFHLQSGSPAVGAGTAHGAPATDLDGSLRPNPPSIGAYEGQPAQSADLTVGGVIGAEGQKVLLSATLTGAGTGVSGRRLLFLVDGAAVGTAVTNSNGTAACSYLIPLALSLGSHNLTAAFAGDSVYAAAAGSATLTVTAAGTGVTLTLINAAAAPGQTVTLTARLRQSANGAYLSGETLTFSVDGVVVGTALTNGSGLAALSYAVPGNASGGIHSLTASFAGDSGHDAGSVTGTLTVH